MDIMHEISGYIAQGWALVPIPSGTKGPSLPGWNTRAGVLKQASDLPETHGVGLGHAYSGTMAFDIDDWFGTLLYGIDVDALYAAPDAVVIDSGKPNRGKLLYRMPPGVVLPTKKFTKRVPGGPTPGHTKSHTLFELRCGTLDGKTVQDVLPPSIHPDTGRPYQWAGTGHWSRLPMVPQQLLDIWQAALADVRPVRVDGADASWEEIEGALKYINPDCSREDWINVGMALHFAGEQTFNPEQALHIWDTWSQGAAHRYPGERAILGQWVSFRTDKASSVTLGTLYHLARQNGWTRPVPDATALFGAVAPTAPMDVMTLLRPSPPPIDLDLFPSILRRRAQELSDGVGCDPLVALWAGMAAVCGAVDARSRLELLPGFQVPPVLWMMTLGEPADKKSPGSRPMLDPLHGIEADDRPRYAKDRTDWEMAAAAYSKAKEARLKWVGTEEHQLGGEAPYVPPEPKEPVPVKITVSDITSQKLVRQIADRPRGMLCYLDEMNSWVGKLTNKMSGDDRSAWVVSYEAARYEMDRVGAGSVHAENFALSIYGNIQPRVLREHFHNLTSDGLLQRFVPCVLRGSHTRLGNPVPIEQTSAADWENVLRLVHSLPVNTYRLSPEAHAAYRSFQAWYEKRKVDERLVKSSETYMTAFGKLEGLVGRLALVFHVIESPFGIEVSADVIERVIRLIKGYIIPVYRFLYDTDDTSSSTFDAWMMDYIIQHADLERMTLSDIRRGARRPFEKADVKYKNEQAMWVMNSMAVLEDLNWVARVDDRQQEHKHIAEWMINPQLRTTFADYRREVVKAKQRVLDTIKRNSKSAFGCITHGIDELE